MFTFVVVMTKFFQKIMSFSLAILVLLSTFSFTVEKHYCGSILVDVSLFSEAKDCGMKMMEVSENSETEVKRKSCCKDEVTFIKGQDNLKSSFDQLDFPELSFTTVFIHDNILLYEISDKKENVFKQYIPPDLVWDFQILHETYLI